MRAFGLLRYRTRTGRASCDKLKKDDGQIPSNSETNCRNQAIALAHRGAAELYSQAVREEFRLGPASSVQKALQSLDSQDILDRYRGEYFFLDPLLPCWIRAKAM